MDPKLKPVLEATLVAVPPNDNGFDVAPKENPEDCVVVVVAVVVVALPKENNGFPIVPGVPVVVVFAVVEDDPKVNPVPVPFEPPNILC